MSEAVTKQVEGVCAAITERNGWTEFEIDGGTQYTTKLATKLPALIEQGRGAGQERAVWTYKESDGKENPNRPGTFYKNRYLEKVEVGGTVESAPAADAGTPAFKDRATALTGTVVHTGRGNEMTKEEWAAKDAAIHHMAAIKAAAAALTHTVPSDPTKEQLNTFVSNVLLVADQFRNVVIAGRDGEEAPF